MTGTTHHGAGREVRMASLVLLAGAIACTSLGSGDDTVPDTFLVEFQTTKGSFTVQAQRAWSPAGVERFHEMVRTGFYDSIPLFRVVPGFVVQFGLTGDAATDSLWLARGLPDEPVVASNTSGRVSFARGGPQTRGAQLFINLADNTRLDALAGGGVVGYPPIGEVIDGMEVVLSFEGRYGGDPSRMQDSISALGLGWLNEQFPGLDYIVSARIR